ncbi:MAG: translocation/assembly module TamB domain-containing protein [Nitrospirae bacterium]|nr:translocation/assembly module TamB domain-containing protein [Nitrospirota bacterium]
MNIDTKNNSDSIISEKMHRDRKRLRKIIYFSVFAIIGGIVIFVSRGPYISNALKRLILPELETALKQKVIAKKIYINIFPFFVEAKGLKVFDDNGEKIIYANRFKGYISPFGLLSKHISITRLVIKEPTISTDKKRIDDLIVNFKEYLKKESKLPFKVKINIVEVSDGVVSLRDEGLKGILRINGLNGKVIFGSNPKLRISMKQLNIKKEGLPELIGTINTSFVLKDDSIDIKNLTIGSYGSEIKGSGTYSKGKLTFKTYAEVLVDSLKRLLDLKERNQGKISAKGEIKLEGFELLSFNLKQLKNTYLDLDIKGNFSIQTLMEVLKVKEKLRGLVDFNGKLKGKLTDISGIAKARLQKGNLFGVEIDSLRCGVVYQNGLMKFSNGNADLYNGKATASAYITLPVVNDFALNINFQSIDIKPVLKLIGWEPEIPAGKVQGMLISSGKKFQPSGWFVYKAKSIEQRLEGKEIKQDSISNVIDRIGNIKGTYSLKDSTLFFSDLQLNTSMSDLRTKGYVYVEEKKLDMKGILDIKDVSDLTLPYYSEIKGEGKYVVNITGTFDNPEISGRINISNASIKGYEIDNITSEFSYNKNFLNVRELIFTFPGEEHRFKGMIKFPVAKRLFDFSKAEYDIDATIRNADLRSIMKIFHKNMPLSGKVNADIKFGGNDKDIMIRGDCRSSNVKIYKIPIGSISTTFSYENKGLSLRKTIIRQGNSMITADGMVFSDNNFSFRLSSPKIFLRDFSINNAPENAFISIHSEGNGTFQNPSIILNGKVFGGTIQGKSLGDGDVYMTIKNRDISLNASLFDENLHIIGKANFNEQFPWTAELNIKPGRYDSLLNLFTKKVPEELLLNLGAHVTLKGDRKNISALANINHLSVALLGYSFSSGSDVIVQVINRKVSFSDFTLKSGDSSFMNIKGGFEIERGYGLHFEGKSSLSPLKGLFKRVDLLTGNGDFSFSILGKWNDPDISGEMKISNTSLGLKGNYLRVSSINGNAYFDEDRFIVRNLTGRTGGGDINLSGVIYFKGFKIKRFYFELDFKDVTISMIKDADITINGNIIYKGIPEAHTINGDIKIKSGRYRERLDWKSFLLKTKTKQKGDISNFENAELNISISGDDNIYIENNVTRTSVKVDIVLRGTILHPLIFGRIESKNGIFYFRNNEFKILHASADFADPNRVNPLINISAETNKGGYRIKLNLEGQIEHFNLTLSSDPHLNEMDILSLLTIGNIGKPMKGFEGGIGAGEATSFLSGALQALFEERLKTVTGFDRIQIDHSISKATGTVETRVTVSKRLLNDRLSVTYSSSVGSSTTQEEIVRLEYLLDRNISLIGVRDERGSVGGDIKFRFEFK